MLTYTYLCGSCKHQFETQQKITEKPLKTCPECKKDSLERVIQNTGFVLKGKWFKKGGSY